MTFDFFRTRASLHCLSNGVVTNAAASVKNYRLHGVSMQEYVGDTIKLHLLYLDGGKRVCYYYIQTDCN